MTKQQVGPNNLLSEAANILAGYELFFQQTEEMELLSLSSSVSTKCTAESFCSVNINQSNPITDLRKLMPDTSKMPPLLLESQKFEIGKI